MSTENSHTTSHPYIADILGDDYKKWTHEKPIVIHAPTGTGKTYFIMNRLLPYAKENNKRILYLTNRETLRSQLEHSVPAEYKESITFWNYQKLGVSHLSSEESVFSNADYYVLDEAHFFLADSSFNSNISRGIDYLKYKYNRHQSSVWIYMTATLPYLFIALDSIYGFQAGIPYAPFLRNPLKCYAPYMVKSVQKFLQYREMNADYWHSSFMAERERFYVFCEDMCVMQSDHKPQTPNPLSLDDKTYFLKRFNQYESAFETIKKKCIYYEIPSTLKKITPVYFSVSTDSSDEIKQFTQIVDAILFTDTSEKWLIFVDNKNQGKLLYFLLKNTHNQDVALIHADNKKENRKNIRDVMSSIRENECFSTRILITTALMDNGINIKDKSLRHIVIFSQNETSFQQMVGRKRFLDDTDHVFVYLFNISEGGLITQFQNNTLDILTFLYKFQRMKKSAEGILTGTDKITDKEIENFWKQYSNKYTFLSKYLSYLDVILDPSNIFHDSGVQEIQPSDPSTEAKLFNISQYPLMRLTYEYYKMMAFFEHSFYERKTYLEEYCDNCSNPERYEDKNFEDEYRLLNYLQEPMIFHEQPKGCKRYIEKNKSLQKIQYSWLKEQLRWLKLNIEDDLTLDPEKHFHWIYYQTGEYRYRYKLVYEFLDSHSNYLTEEQQKIFVEQIFSEFVKTLPPHSIYHKKKRQINSINACLKEYRFPFRLRNKNTYRNQKQRNWWFVETVIIDE